MPNRDDNEGRRRVAIEAVSPEIDGGRFPAKRSVNESVVVEADIFADGHDELAAVLLWRRRGDKEWNETWMHPLENDRWQGSFTVTELGRWEFTVCGWIDYFATWCHELVRRTDAEDISVALQAGAALIESTAGRIKGEDARRLHAFAAALLDPKTPLESRIAVAEDPDLQSLMTNSAERPFQVMYERAVPVICDPVRARFSAWYELFPRSSSGDPNRHGTLRDVEQRLAYVSNLGFDVLYLPPIHPIGASKRKGRNNALSAEADDPGSPWAIGADQGGHKALHPELGTLEEFQRLVARARELGMDIALDIAFQCSPDHPYVSEHPQWFKLRPDGIIQYAENPPKKYEDIYPFNFETDDWQSLHRELKSVVEYWIEQGVTIFRIDNPHTKPFSLWEWLINDIRDTHPEIIFLSEAFTRPKVMKRLAKLGFSQSYTYFAWRNTKSEIEQYFTELTRTDVREYLRPNLWPNTPDILTEHMQVGGRPAFMARLVLAATLGANYGIYGPAFELIEREPREPGSEEYLNSEKYEVRHWDLNRPDSLKTLVARINRIRREHRALQSDWSLNFHQVDNDALICYSKHTPELDEIVLVVVNLDPNYRQSGWVDLPLQAFGIDVDRPYQLHDQISGARYLWHGSRNYLELDPGEMPAHVFRLRRHTRTERDFAYFM